MDVLAIGDAIWGVLICLGAGMLSGLFRRVAD